MTRFQCIALTSALCLGLLSCTQTSSTGSLASTDVVRMTQPVLPACPLFWPTPDPSPILCGD